MTYDEDSPRRRHGAGNLGRAGERNAPMLATRIRGALGVACPKCQASPGHRCRALKLRPDQVPGATTAAPHPERVKAAKR